MAKPRVTATDKLSNVVEVVEMGRRTGLLSIERGTGSVLEVGEIYFISGSPTYATLAGLRGREALAALAHWGPCRFAFDGSAAQPIPNITPTNPALHSWPSHPNGLSRDASQSHPSAPGRAVPDGSGTWHLPSATNGRPDTGSLNRGTSFPAQPPRPSGSGTPRQYGGPDHSLPDASSLAKRPRRSPDVRDLMTVVSAYNLSRSHRTVLLLADGEHTILDLARLSSKSVNEVTTLLADLELRGLVYYYAAE